MAHPGGWLGRTAAHPDCRGDAFYPVLLCRGGADRNAGGIYPAVDEGHGGTASGGGTASRSFGAAERGGGTASRSFGAAERGGGTASRSFNVAECGGVSASAALR